MYLFPVTNGTTAVQMIMFFACILMGLSHILRPKMWEDYFTLIHASGKPAIVTRTFTLELWPALLIVTLHQVWTGPAIVLTVYGWALLLKVSISILFPSIGMKSLEKAQRGGHAFIFAGIALMAIGACAGWALFL